MIYPRTKIQSHSGVYPISLYLKPQTCTSKCIYCPIEKDLPKSYLLNQDTKLAQTFNFCPTKQLSYHINDIRINNSNYILQFEIIILGGTFSDYDEEYRNEFVLSIYNVLNDYNCNSLSIAKQLNESSINRCSVLTIETRPDKITTEELMFLLELGVTKIELGVQSLNNTTLKKNNRAYTLDDIIQATNKIKTYGFKVSYHIMIGLPYSDIDEEVTLFNKYLWKSLNPDYLKIYPFIYLGSKFQPYLDNFIYQENIVNVYEKAMIELKKFVPPYVRISRVNRQFDWLDNIPIIDRKKISQFANCQCIKCKEPYYRAINITSINYDFIECNNDVYLIAKSKNYVVGILRAYKIDDILLIRELKIFGLSANIGKKTNAQGRGIGKKLMDLVINKFEKKDFKIKVLSSTGAMAYYYKFGFKKNNSYLILE